MGVISPNGRRFATKAQLKNDIEEQLGKKTDVAIKRALEDISKEVKIKMEEYMLEFYSEYHPKYYERTGQLLEAVRNAESKVYKTNKIWKILIKTIDINEIESGFAGEGQKFNHYMDFNKNSTYGGKRYSNWVVEWVDVGSENGRVYGHSPIFFSERINKYLDTKVNQRSFRRIKKNRILQKIKK